MFLSDLFLALFNRAMAAGWLVLAAILLRFLLKKVPGWSRCLLWALVGLRLVWPFSLQSGLSLLPSREVLPPEMLYARQPELHTGIAFVNTALNQSFTPAMTAQEFTSVNPLQIWTWLAGWIWVLGAAALLGYGLFSFLRLRRQVAASVEEDGLWRCDGIDSPFLLGLFRPRIYVPSHLNRETLRYVQAHEQAHLARRDHWWKPLGYLLLTVFWFHPLMWAGYILLCRDIETACDERVVKSLSAEEKKAYSMALVDCAVLHRRIAACPVAFGEVSVKGRVRRVLRYKKPALWITVTALLLCAAAAVCFLTDPAGFRLDFARSDMQQVTAMDLRPGSGEGAWELSADQQEELWFRLRDLKKTRRADLYGGFTPFYALSVQLGDGQWLRIQGYDLESSRTDLVYGDTVYKVEDDDFCRYLSRVCTGGDRASPPAPAADLSAGGVWITDRCLYMTPYSSTLSGPDSGFYYYIDGSAFVLGLRTAMAEKRIAGIRWLWRKFPWTEEEWADYFMLQQVDISGYAERLYQPLDQEKALLSMDGQLWLIEIHGEILWSIHRLQPVQTVTDARWAYMDGVDESHRSMVVEFSMDYDEVALDCDQGQLFGAYTNVNNDSLHYYGDRMLYWTPLNADGTTAPDQAEITFAIWQNNTALAEGVLTLNRNGQCAISVSGTPPTGIIRVMDADGNLLFTVSLPAEGPPQQ